MHLRRIYDEKELDENATCKDFLQVRKEGARTIKRKQKHYHLDAIISVGYRVKSIRATQFRIWATQRLKEYLVQGYTVTSPEISHSQWWTHSGIDQYTAVNGLSNSENRTAYRFYPFSSCFFLGTPTQSGCNMLQNSRQHVYIVINP